MAPHFLQMRVGKVHMFSIVGYELAVTFDCRTSALLYLISGWQGMFWSHTTV